MSSRTTTRTIRIDDDLDQKIERLAKADGTSVNFVANAALREHLEWYLVAKRFGMASFSLSLVNKFIEKFDEKECEALGRWAAIDLFKPYVEYQFGDFTMETFLESCERFARYSGRFRFDHTRSGGRSIIFLKHGSGRKWSYYYDGLIKSIFEDLLHCGVKTELTDELLVSKVDYLGGE
jgi:hypothetical protein